MGEKVSIREAARRLGVSDTAVHKAIRANRVATSGNTPSGRPLMDWEETERRWHENSDSSKRSHVGSQGSPRRKMDTAAAKLPLSSSGAGPGAGSDVQPAGGAGPSYAQSRAVRELFSARLAKLEFEQRSGRLVDVDELKVEAFKVHRRIRDSILNIPDRCAPQLAAMSDAVDIHAFLLAEITAVLRQLSADIRAPYSQNA